MQLIDSYQRKINYLRLSITDRCNLRCRYCMPAKGVPAFKHDEVLRYESLLRIAKVAACLGIKKIRVTGGEPLVRKGVINFLRQLNRIPGVSEVTLTTNGILLQDMAEQLKDAGVKRINMSLDSLQNETYRSITRGGDLQQALAGLEQAEQAGLQIKLNMVVMRGINDQEVEDFAALSVERPWSVRFIEYMPVVREETWRSQVISGAEILSRLRDNFDLEELSRSTLCGPAKPYRIRNTMGTIGIITPMSNHFCGSCNRLRITAGGFAKSCLLSESATDLRPFLRQGDDALRSALLNVATKKSLQHNFMEEVDDCAAFSMARIGG